MDTSQTKERLLKGVMRIGLLAKGLLLRSDKEVREGGCPFHGLLYAWFS